MKLKCRKCSCTYFEKVMINEFHDYEGGLYGSLAEINPASDVRGYRCVKCQTLNIPTLGYSSPQPDRELSKTLTDLSDGGEVKPDRQTLRSRRIAEGSVGTVENENNTDPSVQGTFTRK
jgi:hypothetical protein